jgi:predicted permease
MRHALTERLFATLTDIRIAIRSLSRSPGLVLVAVVTLGLGIGANTSMFSLLYHYTLRPATYADRDRMDRIYRATPRTSVGAFSPADYLAVKPEMKGYGDIAAYGGADVSIAEAGHPAEMAVALRASANLFDVLGSRPRLGRSFRPDEEVFGNHRVLIISDRYWQIRFGGARDIVGRKVRVDGEPYQIVGVLPPDFSDWRHLSFIDVYRPLAFDEKESRDRSSTWIRLVGRRDANLTRAQASAFIADFGRRLAHDFPSANADTTWRTLSIDESFLPGYGRVIVSMLVGLSGFVLLIACSNLANLLLARTMARAREFAVRAALGASRARLLRPLVVESLLLALAGGLVAILVALWTFDWFAVRSAGENGVGVDFRLDWHILLWALAASLFTAVAFGIAPALFALRLDLNSTLKSGGRGHTGDRGHQRFRSALVVGQFALAMVLLAGAGLFVRGLDEIKSRRHGWESDQLVTGALALPATTYPGDKEVADFQRLVLQRLEALPGVTSASVSYDMPFFGLAEPRRYLVAGRETPPPGREPVAVINGVSPHYFETVGTRLLSGRAFNEGDTVTSPRVYVVNQGMVRGLFGGESPIGRRIAEAGGKTVQFGEIVGVVSDVESIYPTEVIAAYQVYQPIAQEPRRAVDISVRTAGSTPAALIDGVRKTIMSIDPDLPVRQLQTAEARISRANYQNAVLASTLSWLAALGLGLAALGTYGVLSRTMAQRTPEFGIRLALGARAWDITRLVLRSGATLALIGAALGLLGAFAISRGITAFFPGMHTNSAAVLAGVTGLLMAIALIACYMPARHAARINPVETLRAE